MLRNLAVIFALFALLAPAPLSARGKNKVIDQVYEWNVYETDHFKIYHYKGTEHLLPAVADKAEASYNRVSNKLQHELNFKVPFIFYKTHEEFEDTNVFPGFLPRYVGAFAEPFQSRMLLPVDMPPEELYALITHELTHIFQYDMLYNNRISTIIRAQAPIWFTEGMASWVADDENNLDRMVLRDLAVNSPGLSLARFAGQSYIAYRIGHAAFDFIEDRYGIEGVRDFLWQYRKNIAGRVGGAIQRAFNVPPDEFDRDLRKYLRKRYVTMLAEKEEPDDFAREIRTRRTITTLSPELSPSGDLFAAIVPIKNDVDLVLISTKDGRIFKNLTKGLTNAYSEINVGAYYGVNDLGWNSDGNEIVFAARREGTMALFVVDVLKGSIKERIDFDGIRDAQAPIFGTNDDTILFGGNQNGYYDIFEYNRNTKTTRNLTDDPYLDRNPRLSPDGKEIVYSSNRDGFYKIFGLDLDSTEKTQLTSGLGNDIQASYSTDMSSIYFSSDRFDDIYNVYELELETGVKKQYTNVITGAFSPQERVVFDHKEGEEKRQLVFTAFYQGRYRVYRMDKPEDREEFYDVARDNFANAKEYNMTANVELDPEQFYDYKLKGNFSVSNASVNAGATDDGRFISNTLITFTDTLANHQLVLNTYTISSFENYFVSYLNRTRRWQWGSSVSYVNSFYTQLAVDDNGLFIDRDRVYKDAEATAYVVYPFNTFARVEAAVGFNDNDSFTYGLLAEGSNEFGVIVSDYSEPFASAAFSYDTIRYREYGPQHGMGFDAAVRHTLDVATSYSVDWRLYREVTRRSLFALRVLGNYSDGDVPQWWALGGTNNLRGDLEFRSLIGSRRVLTQAEFRFPLVDALMFPGGFGFRNMRAAAFVDVGGTWWDDDAFNFELEDEATFDPSLRFPNPDYLLGAVGFNLSFFFQGLELNWTWSQRTNFEDFGGSYRMDFWIGRNF